ncbi:MAG: LETM1 domain-containing protein [Polaribacter sp.]|nr:LETM1 domain-containing protein [Polaribacter sp.]MDG1953720.1 LETM1 domain-containing protein [Polaribacter sp.]MDG2072978.1 LETM1 domain-containing protein [Polaribacter sp.]
MSTTIQDIKESIHKNKLRLGKEIRESKELFSLLTKSTHKKLTSEEKKKVKEQLLDICKSVPALAVFMLPGGALLLPLLIKLIPDILPSSFREDSIDIDLK